MDFKKLLSLSAVLACGLTLAACTDPATSEPTNTPSDESSVVTPGGETVDVHVGVGYDVSWNGSNQVDVTTAMVAFEADGTIAGTRIDVVQVKVTATTDAEGAAAVAISSTYDKYNEDGTIKTKLELGSDYNMSMGGAIPVVGEVDAQIEAFANWTEGKTIEEMRAGFQQKESHGEMADYMADGVLASCSIVVGAFANAIESAWELKSTDTYTVATDFATGVAVNANLYTSTELSVDLGGALVVDGTVVAAAVDAVVVDFVVEGETVSLLTEGNKYLAEDGTYLSKKARGAGYGMANAQIDKNGDGITLEWFEQAAVIETACVGKTSEQIAALVKGEGDLATATINLSTYVGSVAKAATYAELEHVGPQA